jgi:cytidine deaminase
VTPDELIGIAAALARPLTVSADCTSGSVAAALVTGSGNVYTGVCVDTECSLGFCAEHAAVAEMLKARECEIRMIVAVDWTGKVLSPCGRCRELMWQVVPHDTETRVILNRDLSLALADLLPFR